MFTYIYFLVCAGAFGLVVGSFLNVVIHRLPAGESVVRPRSRCPECGHAIAWYDNVPVLSYLILRGRCRGCGTPISIRYALVELLTCAVSIAVYWQTVPAVDLHHVAPSITDAEAWAVAAPVTWVHLATWLFYFVFFSGMIAVFFIDLKHFIVPNEITFLLLPTGLLGCTGLWFAGAAVPHPLHALAGAATGGGVLLAVGVLGSWVFRKEAMGMGDVKLLATIGAFLGIWPTLLVVVLLSAMGGSVIGIVLRIVGRAQHGVPEDPREKAEVETESGAESEGESEIEGRHSQPPDQPIPEPRTAPPDVETDDAPPVGYYIPFGPFLVAASFVYFMVGDLLVSMYETALY